LKKKEKKTESFDGNIWSPVYWKRISYLFFSLWDLTLLLVIFQLSFANIFSPNLWTFMAVIKIIFVISELFFEIIHKEKLLMMHIASTNGINQSKI